MRRSLAPSADANLRAVPGWWGSHASSLGQFNVTGAYRKTPNTTHMKLKAKWNLPQSLKFEFSLAAATADVRLLADTWVPAVAHDDELRRALVGGMRSAQAEAHGWNALIDALRVGDALSNLERDELEFHWVRT